MEKSLALTISSFQERLPGLNLYQHIYNQDDELDIALQGHIVSAYLGFMSFCIKATKYYKNTGIGKHCIQRSHLNSSKMKSR